MNLLAASNATSYFKYMFADWAIALYIFFAVLILLAVLFKGLKVGIILIIIAAVLAGLGVLTAFVFMLINWDLLRIIDFAIKWGPTILFVTIITISTLVNAKRGLRKSLILLAQAVGACVVCTIFFYVCVNSEGFDRLILQITNLILKNNSGLQNMLGVSPECSTLREIFAEWLPNLLGGDLKILFAANPQYLITLADMAFRIVIAVLTLVIYFILVFILYLIYFFAYPERRYKKKRNLAVTRNTADRTYKKHHIGGGAVGLVRGITAGLLSLSFIGSAFFMVAGGMGYGTMGDYDWDNDDYNFYYSIYRSVESYGSQGIFKVLNTMTDSRDTPFYLFAADMVLSGDLDDEENDIDDKNINFREEIAAYTGFARKTLKLLMKYGEDDIVAIINGRGGDDAFDTIVNIMTIPGFREEFDVLIKEFDSKTYVINLGMSLINTIVDRIDDISFTSSIGEDDKELIKILFKKGHLSETIPDELKLKQDIEAGILSPGDVKARPRIKVSHLLNKDDIRIALEVALSILSGEQKTDDTMGLVKALLPEIKQLSILKTSRSGELDPVLARLYCYYENKYLTMPGEAGITYTSVANKNIKWLEELNTLLDVTDDALTFWNNIYDEHSTALDMALWAFDKDNPDCEENERCYDNICNALENSEIIGTAMSTSYMYHALKYSLAAISENIYIPENLVYNRTVNADGSVTMGELHQFFKGFRLLASPENRAVLDKALDYADGNDVDTTELLKALSDALKTKDDYGYTLSHYFTESYLLRSVLSIVMIERGEDSIYVPVASLDRLEDGTVVNMINKRELKELLDNLTVFVEFVKPLLDGDSDPIKTIADYLQNNEDFAYLVENNRIYEGTVANLLVTFIKNNEYVVVPQSLIDSVEGWITVNGRKGELRNLLDALKTAEVDLAKIAGGEFEARDLFDMLLSLDTDKAEDLLESRILHYTLSKYLIDGTETGGFKLIVPNGAREQTEEGDSIDWVVRKSELIKLFTAVAEFDLSEELDISSVLYKLVVNRKKLDDSLIMSASIVYTIVNNNDVKAAITIPKNYLAAGDEESLLNYNSSNIWKAELPRFIDALDEILGISGSEGDFVFDGDTIQDSLSRFLTELNAPSHIDGVTKLELCYNSDIVWSEFTVRLDETLLDNNIVPKEVLSEAKSRGYYKLDEVQALSDALDIFGIEDLLGATGSDIIDSVKGRVLSLNDKLEEYGEKTALEVIYRSSIIRYIFSNEIDKALEKTVESEIVAYIKSGRSYYPLQDVAEFIDAAKEIDIEGFDSITDFDFSQIENLTGTSRLYPDSDRTRIDVIYSSRIAAGIITKSLYDVLKPEGIDHSKAYEEGIKLYRQEEIESLYTIFGDFEDFDIKNVDLEQVSECLYDEFEETHSYLIASLISKVVKDNENFIIPVDVLDAEGCILPRESSLIISVFKGLSEGQDLEDMENWEISEIPTGETRRNLFASEIMRACVTYNLGVESYEAGKSVYVSPDYIKSTRDTTGDIILIISETEFNNLAAALDLVQGGSTGSAFEIHKFELDEIAEYDEETLNTLLKSDIMYYKICECLLNNSMARAYLTGRTRQQDAINVYNGGSPEKKEVVPEEAIREFIEYYKQYKGLV